MVGGGSNLINLEQYCSNFFKIHVNKLDEKNKLKNNKRIYDNFSSCLGAMKIITDGWETEAIPEPINKYGQKTSFFSRIFGGQ